MTKNGDFPGHAIIISAASDLGAVVDRDADEVEAALLDPARCNYSSKNVLRLKGDDATLENVLSALKNLKSTLIEEPALFYFSGHGYENTATGDTGLCLKDGHLSSALFSQIWGGIPSSVKIIMLDSCFAGGMPAVKDGTKNGSTKARSLDVELLNVGQGSVVLASSRSDQTSTILSGDRLSLFTKHLVGGLRGAAGHDSEGYVTLFDLFAYVRANVSGESADQTPVLSASQLSDNIRLAYCPDQRLRKSPPASARGTGDVWAGLLEVLATLYPLGPSQEDIWNRAGGDESRIVLSGTGRSQWRNAIRNLRLGGGGPITIPMLLTEGLDDYPGYSELQKLLRLEW